MPKKLSMAFMGLLLAFAPFATYSELLPCSDLKEIVEALDDLADIMEEVEPGDIPAESESDMSLGDLSSALKQIAKAEENDGLRDAANLMYSVWDTEGAWTEQQLSKFKMGLDSAVMNIERIHYNECE
jgi:hypothetical protein